MLTAAEKLQANRSFHSANESLTYVTKQPNTQLYDMNKNHQPKLRKVTLLNRNIRPANRQLFT